MRRIITLSALALALSSGVALADRHNGGGPVVRDHRDRAPARTDNRTNTTRWNNNRPVVRDNRQTWRGNERNVVRVNRERPTFRGDRFYFNGGYSRPYVRPVINVRYRDYYRRPALIVENYDAVPGYIWIQGTWNWTGYEWSWVPGHYEVDQGYDDGYNASVDWSY
jgi:hypothetical protein